MPSEPLPPWLDRRTLEWAAARVDALAARALNGPSRVGLEGAAGHLRSIAIEISPPLAPVSLDQAMDFVKRGVAAQQAVDRLGAGTKKER
jgi:hypothetical protein